MMNKAGHNREETKKKICEKCQSVIKGIDIIRGGKKIGGYSCGCGIFTKKGEKID
jgi:hypothetical protein